MSKPEKIDPISPFPELETLPDYPFFLPNFFQKHFSYIKSPYCNSVFLKYEDGKPLGYKDQFRLLHLILTKIPDGSDTLSEYFPTYRGFRITESEIKKARIYIIYCMTLYTESFRGHPEFQKLWDKCFGLTTAKEIYYFLEDVKLFNEDNEIKIQIRQ